MRAVVGFSFLPFFNPKMVYFYYPILPIVYTQVWLQLISNLMCSDGKSPDLSFILRDRPKSTWIKIGFF